VWTDCINLLEANIEAVRVGERFFNIGHLDEVIAGHESVVSGDSLAGSNLGSMFHDFSSLPVTVERNKLE
jgi:hypothetical protein